MLKKALLLLIYINSVYAVVIVQNIKTSLVVPRQCRIDGIPTETVSLLLDSNAKNIQIPFSVKCNMDDDVKLSIVSDQFDKEFYLLNSTGVKFPISFYINQEHVLQNNINISQDKIQNLSVKIPTAEKANAAGSYSGVFSITVIY